MTVDSKEKKEKRRGKDKLKSKKATGHTLSKTVWRLKGHGRRDTEWVKTLQVRVVGIVARLERRAKNSLFYIVSPLIERHTHCLSVQLNPCAFSSTSALSCL